MSTTGPVGNKGAAPASKPNQASKGVQSKEAAAAPRPQEKVTISAQARAKSQKG